MVSPTIVWDLDEEPDGNVQHIAEHDLTKEEVESVLLNLSNSTDESHSSGLPVTFGWTDTGRHIIVVWELANDDPRMLYPSRPTKCLRPGARRP